MIRFLPFILIRGSETLYRTFCILMCSFLVSSFCFGQTKISGKVEHSGIAMVAIEVVLDSQFQTQTDEDGRFSFEDVSPGVHIVSMTQAGFEEEIIPIEILAGRDTFISSVMRESRQTIQNVVVTGKTELTKIKEQSYNVTVIDAKKLYNTSSDLNQVLNRTTGVRVRESGGLGSNFNFSLNGFSGNQVKFFLDGIPMTNYGSALTLNNLPINIAERIEVYKGVVPVSLGADALGGAVNIITNKKIKRYVDASYSFGSFNTHRVSLNGRYTADNGFTVNANAFYNYSDNNYKVDVSVADTLTGKFGPEQKLRHFHDAYQSGGLILETGVVGKKYADRLLIGIIASGNKKEIQQGTNMQFVVGEAYTSSKSIIPTLKYAKNNLFITGLSFNLSSSYNIAESNTVDTSSKVYNWTGGYTYRRYGNNQYRGELIDKRFYIYKERDFLTVTNLSYDFLKHHSLSVNYTYDNYTREEDDRYKPDRLGMNTPSVVRNIAGLAYKIDALRDRLSVTAFGKLYGLNTHLVADDSVNLSSAQTNYGYGIAGTYFFLEHLQLKASFEHAYRLPSVEEFLGDGLLTQPNPLLKPESSNNINLGASFSKTINNHAAGIDIGFIYRDAADFIRVNGVNNLMKYENMKSARVSGLEGSLRYGYKRIFTFEANATYQRVINTEQFRAGTTAENYLYKEQVPNIPILFGNADFTLNFTNVKFSDDALSVNFSLNYMDAFYLFWPNLGDPDYKKSIPSQFTQSLGMTYSLKNGRYNFNVECNNITDVKMFDYFNVQKPGRMFSAKFRYSFFK